jgi:mannose-1-phosphate guanylyltransferase
LADASDIHPVILCGGAGTRLWPLSRRSYPKQFSPLFEGGTLFQRTIARIAGQGYAAPLLLTTSEFRFIVAEQLSDAGLETSRTGGPKIIIEPEMRNTAPAVCLAALMVAGTCWYCRRITLSETRPPFTGRSRPGLRRRGLAGS